MGRAIIAIIVSFLAVNLLIMAMFFVVMMALGLEGTLRPGEYWTTTTFNVIVLIGGTIIAAAGGALCAVIAKSWRPALVVAGLMLAFGLVGAFQNSKKPDPPARPAAMEGESEREYTMHMLEEMPKHGKEPVWFSFTTPIVGALAFLGGARLVGCRRRSKPVEGHA